jgi:hypothetical protein
VYEADVLALMTKNIHPKEHSSARLVLIAPIERSQKLASVAGGIQGYAVETYKDVNSAALAIGLHFPAVVVLDLTDKSRENVAFLRSLASNPELSEVKIVVVARQTIGTSGLYDPKRIKFVSDPEMLPESIRGIFHKTLVHMPPTDGDLPFPITENEGRRLVALENSRLVDSPPEDVYDRLAWLASHTLNVPVALFTMLTSDRQWFKARHGLEALETPRSWAFCNYTILQRDVFTVRNLANDKRFADNPAVKGGLKFRFYAGAPVVDADGFALGSLCIIDRKPRTLDQKETEILRCLAHLASDAVQSRSANSRLHKF